MQVSTRLMTAIEKGLQVYILWCINLILSTVIFRCRYCEPVSRKCFHISHLYSYNLFILYIMIVNNADLQLMNCWNVFYCLALLVLQRRVISVSYILCIMKCCVYNACYLTRTQLWYVFCFSLELFGQAEQNIISQVIWKQDCCQSYFKNEICQYGLIYDSRQSTCIV